MKSAITPSYTFTPSTRQIDFTGISSFSVAKLYAVINVTRNQLIYAVGQPKFGYTTSSGTLVTFVYDTTGMNAADVLTIIYDQNGVIDLPSGASTSALQTTGNASLSSIDTKTPTLGQKTSANSSPVVIASDQSAIPVSQSGSWSIVNVSGTVSLPTGASTESTLSALSAKLPASLGAKVGASSLSVVPNTDTPFPVSQSGVWNVTNISGTVSLPTGASTESTLSTMSAKFGTQTDSNLGTPSASTQRVAAMMGVGAAAVSASNPVPTTGNRSNAGTDLASGNTHGTVGGTDGTNLRPLLVSSAGRASVDVNSSALPSGAATSALQTTGNSSLSSIDGKVPALGQALAAGSVPVVLTAAQLASLVGSLGPVTPGTVAGNSSLVGGQYNFTAPILVTGQQAALQTNYRGELLVAQSLSAPTTDAANRLRVSEQVQAVGYTFALSDNLLSFNTSTATGGTVAHVPGSALTRLTVTTASGSQAIIQTRRYLRYTPGVSHMVNLSVVVGASKANVTKRWGFFDALDGKFFQQTSAALSIVVRSSTSGSAVDAVVNQSSWNIDKLDGTGPSGLTLDVTKDNLYIIDFSWHGASRVRFGVLLNGIKVYCHEYIASNTFTVPYTRSPFLPIRTEITNTAATASNTSIDLVACSGFKESSEPYSPTYNFARSTARTFKNANATAAPFLSIRPRTTFDTLTNRVVVQPTEVQVLAGTVAVVLLLVLNPTLTGAAFADVDTTYSATQVDTAATAYSGGTVVAEYFVQASTSQSFSLDAFSDAILLGLNIAGTTADILSVVLQSTAGNSSSGAVIRWGEYQ